MNATLKYEHRNVTTEWLGLFAAGLLLFAAAAQGEIIGPYAPDADTLHLWHMNESVVPVVDAGTDGTHLTALRNGATLGNLSPSGFGLALSTSDGGPDALGDAGRDAYLSARPLVSDQGDNVLTAYAGTTGAFTYEAIVRIDFDPQSVLGSNIISGFSGRRMQILSLDAEESTNRVCGFCVVPIGVSEGDSGPLLEFSNFTYDQPQILTAPIPTTGPDAIAKGNWYHVAVTYQGTPDQPDNLKFYWSLLDSNRTVASLIGTGRMSNSLPVGCQPDLAIGQSGRQDPVTSRPNNNFVGLIDELRVSSRERSPSQMMFGTPPTLAAAPTPADTAITAPAAWAETASLTGPGQRKWESAGWLIAGALLLVAGGLGWRTIALKRLIPTTADNAAPLGIPPTQIQSVAIDSVPLVDSAKTPVSATPRIALGPTIGEAMAALDQGAGGSAILSQPPSSDDWKRHPEDNVERHTAAIDFCAEGFHGVLRKVGLQDLIQMECLNQRSSILEITTEKVAGRIYLERGEILHATAGKYAGEKAFIKLFSQRGGEFNLKPFEPPVERTIHCHWIHLLLEAARQRDEDTVRLHKDKLTFTRSATSVGDMLEVAAMLADHPQVTEVMVCSNEGKLLYNSKCQDHAGRVQVCLDLMGVAKYASSLLPLGEFDQVEILCSGAKTLIRGDQECHLLIGMDASTIT